jgi:hypothetical protein
VQLEKGIDDQLMAMAAHRYCLGRRSYIVGSCINWIRATWTQFSPQTQFVMLRDTVEGLASNRAGDELIDAPAWADLALWMVAQMGDDRTNEVRRALSYKNGTDAFLPSGKADEQTPGQF